VLTLGGTRDDFLAILPRDWIIGSEVVIDGDITAQ